MRDYYYDIEDKKGCKGQLIGMVIGLFVCLLLTLCFSSCRTIKEHTISVDSTLISKVELSSLKDSLSTYRLQYHNLITENKQRDSIYNYHKDSTFVLIKGDSTIIEHWRENIIYKEYSNENNVYESLFDSLNIYHSTIDSCYSRLDSMIYSLKDQKVVEQVRYIPLYYKIAFAFSTLSIILIMVYISLFYFRKN